MERHRAEEQGGEEQRADRNGEDREQVPADPDSPPQRATQQITDPARPSVAAVMRNPGSAKPKTAPMALNGRGGAPKNSTGIQLAQKITNASTR